MAEVSPQEAARIVSHMNKEHSESLAHYLEHHGKVPSSAASINPQITSFTTPSMTLQYGPPGKRKDFVYKFDPPMMAGQARTRLEGMHRESRAALGLSEVTINSFSLNTSTLVVLFVMLVIEASLFLCSPSLVAGYMPWAAKRLTPILRRLTISPTPAHLGTAVKCAFLGFLWSMHVIEIVLVLRPLMRKYNMTSTSARSLYTIATFISGFGVWGFLKRTGEKLEWKMQKEASKSH